MNYILTVINGAVGDRINSAYEFFQKRDYCCFLLFCEVAYIIDIIYYLDLYNKKSRCRGQEKKYPPQCGVLFFEVFIRCFSALLSFPISSASAEGRRLGSVSCCLHWYFSLRQTVE